MSNHQDKGLRYSLERDRTQHMDAETLETRANHPELMPAEQAAARDELIERQDPK